MTGRLGGAFLFVEHLPGLVLLGCTSSTSHGPSPGAGGKATRGPGHGGGCLFSETEKRIRGVISLWRKKKTPGVGWKITKNHIGCMYGIFTRIYIVDFYIRYK